MSTNNEPDPAIGGVSGRVRWQSCSSAASIGLHPRQRRGIQAIPNNDYVVEIEKFAQKHFIKKFRKKFKKAWEITETAIIQEAERIDRLVGLTDKTETVAAADGYCLVKLYFSVAGTKKSAKGSGDRAIILVDNSSYICKILLVYSKNEICPPNETQKWMRIIKSNYPSIWKIFHGN